MTTLEEVRARFARDQGLPFADSLSQASILDALDQHGVTFRDRIFSPVTTIWGFLSQVLSDDHSCRDAVSRILAHRAASGLEPCSPNTASYCNARSLSVETPDKGTRFVRPTSCRERHMATVLRLPIVGVLGSGSDEHQDRAAALKALAGHARRPSYGAGQGVMAAVSKAFAETPGRKGLVLGVVPCIAEDRPEFAKPGYPNEWVDVPIRTHLHLSGPQGTDVRPRNHIVIPTANVVVALPGGLGTASEVQLALRYKKPVIAYLSARDELAELPPDVKWDPDLKLVNIICEEYRIALTHAFRELPIDKFPRTQRRLWGAIGDFQRCRTTFSSLLVVG